MTSPQNAAHPGGHSNAHLEIFVSGMDLEFRSVLLADLTSTGAQIAQRAGHTTLPETTILQVQAHGTEDIGPTEVANLELGRRFIIAETDRLRRLTIQGDRYDWPGKSILASAVRKLGSIEPAKRLYLERTDRPDELLTEDQTIDLDRDLVERFTARIETWELNVQGVRLTVSTPSILVRDAIVRAGYDPNRGWHLFLRVAGQPKEEVTLDSVIDLTRPGIEKLRVVPRVVNNGEGATANPRQFELLACDQRHLDMEYPGWMAVIESGRRWVLLPNYVLPDGYTRRSADLAVEIPPTYPLTEIDMFYLNPEAALSNGATIPATDVRQSIAGRSFQRWSRHRGEVSVWQPSSDNIITHLALVESAILREVQQ